MQSDRIAVWLDTDPGSDIDDALALAYLLAQPRCELLGVSTVSGDTRKRAAIVRHLCYLAGRGDVPVLAGLSEPLGSGPGQPDVPHFEALPEAAKALGADPEDAIDGLYRRLSERPGEVTLLAIGPMTNVGALFQRYPDAPMLLKQIMLMCGAFRSRPDREVPEVEHNVRCDPDAAKVLFDSAAHGSLHAVGLDVTLDCRLAETVCRSRFAAGGPVLRAILEMAEVWFKGAPQIIFHDPLAAALLFAPEIGRFGCGDVSVDVGDAVWPGKTHWTRGPKESVEKGVAQASRLGSAGTMAEASERQYGVSQHSPNVPVEKGVAQASRLGDSGSKTEVPEHQYDISQHSPKGRHYVAEDVDPDAFMAHYFETVGG